MMGHKICFYGEILLIIPKLSLLLLLIWSTGICSSSVSEVVLSAVTKSPGFNVRVIKNKKEKL